MGVSVVRAEAGCLVNGLSEDGCCKLRMGSLCLSRLRACSCTHVGMISVSWLVERNLRLHVTVVLFDKDFLRVMHVTQSTI